jgi:hypothetical protein
MTSNITRTPDLIASLKKNPETKKYDPHAYALGWIWGMLTEQQRQEVLDRFEVKESN